MLGNRSTTNNRQLHCSRKLLPNEIQLSHRPKSAFLTCCKKTTTPLTRYIVLKSSLLFWRPLLGTRGQLSTLLLKVAFTLTLPTLLRRNYLQVKSIHHAPQDLFKTIQAQQKIYLFRTPGNILRTLFQTRANWDTCCFFHQIHTPHPHDWVTPSKGRLVHSGLRTSLGQCCLIEWCTRLRVTWKTDQ